MTEFIRVNINSPKSPYVQPRNAKGQFSGAAEFAGRLADANARFAKEMQAEVLDQMASHIKRRNVSSGRLLKVTGDSRNVESDGQHYAVGIVDFLDNSMAKYWRQIEEGTSVHVGAQITGFWGGSIGQVTADRVWGARPWSRHNSARDQDMFVPANWNGRHTYREGGKFATAPVGTGGNGGAPSFVKTTTIKNPIQPHEDYADAFTSFQPGRRSLEEVTSLIRSASLKAWHVV